MNIASMVNPQLEKAIMDGIAPEVERLYEHHMNSGSRAAVQEPDESTGILEPNKILYLASKLPERDYETPELVDAVYTSYSEHERKLREKGVILSPVISRVAHLNLGTEDNITWYHADQLKVYGIHPVFRALITRWTAEESTHGPLIQKWGSKARVISERRAHYIQARQITYGIHVETDSVVSINAFTDPQEGGTVDAHLFLGEISDPIGRIVMRRLAGVEAKHNKLFRNMGRAIYSLDQELIDYALPIEAHVHGHFAMPGEKGYPEFESEALRIAAHGIFTLKGIIARQRERVEDLGLLNLRPKSELAKKALDRIAFVIDPDSRYNKHRQSRIDKETDRLINESKANGTVPFILGRTVIADGGELHVLPDAA